MPRGLCGRNFRVGEYTDHSPRVNSPEAVSKWMYLDVLRPYSQGGIRNKYSAVCRHNTPPKLGDNTTHTTPEYFLQT